MKAPFYKVYLEGDEKKDISEFIDGINYEDCANKDSQIEFNVHKEKVNTLLDDESIVAGTMISFQFGFMGQALSEVHTAVIKDIEASFDTYGRSCTIRAMDKGVRLKKNSNTKIWKNITTLDIVKSIAQEHGLSVIIGEVTQKYDSLPQANRSDMDLLKYLAQREDAGNFISYIRNDTLYFVPRGTDTDSQVTYTYGDGSSIESFKPKYRESTNSQAGKETEVQGFDPLRKVRVTDTANAESERKAVTLGEWKSVYSDVGKLVKRVFVVPETDPKEVSNIANAEKKKSNLKLLEATLITEGDPALKPNRVITINGVPRRYTGNWLVEKVRHTITNSGYRTMSTLVKDGQKTGKVKADKANTNVGPKKTQETYKVKIYNQNGALIRTERRNK